MKHPAPRAGRETSPFWNAAAGNRLSLPYCEACAAFQWPPRGRCIRCDGAVTWRDSAGIGRVASYSVVRRPVNPDLKEEVPYIVAFVELEEGVRLFTNIVDVAPEDVHVGLNVYCRFEATMQPGIAVPVFAASQGEG